MFDHSKTMTINGEVVELRWVNPHVSLSVNGIVKERAEDGAAVWVMEMTSPGNLVRAGALMRASATISCYRGIGSCDAASNGVGIDLAPAAVCEPLKPPERSSCSKCDAGQAATFVRRPEFPGASRASARSCGSMRGTDRMLRSSDKPIPLRLARSPK
jgi:hypothetical protein